jgi:hypothetical protein
MTSPEAAANIAWFHLERNADGAAGSTHIVARLSPQPVAIVLYIADRYYLDIPSCFMKSWLSK